MKKLMPRASRLLRYLGAVFFAGLFTGFSVGAMADGNQGLDIVALSSPPDAVSGGNVLVRVELPRNVSSNDLVISLNGQAVTSAFRPEAGQNSLLGLVTGLTLGKNVVTAKAIGRNNQAYGSAQLVLTNYPITGPIF